MSATDVGAWNVPPAQEDDLDDLFDYNVDDAFRDVDTNMDVPARGKTGTGRDEKEKGADLGLDEEIKVTKKRAPVPKLDENRSASGKSRSQGRIAHAGAGFYHQQASQNCAGSQKSV